MRRLLTAFAVSTAVALFGHALWRLFDLRFATGDVYPPGSSFRADPLGTRAFYESLALLPGVRAQRLLEPIRRLGNGRGTTLLILACEPWDAPILNPRDAVEIDDFLTQGGRVVITFQAVTTKPPVWRSGFGPAPINATNAPPRRPGTKRRPADEPAEARPVSFAEHWGFGFDYPPLGKDTNSIAQPALAQRTKAAAGALPAALPWRSVTTFTGLATNWTALYSRNDAPVVIARPFGQGTLVLAGDSYFLSNEALRRDRATPLLAWLASDNSRIVFEETHLGSELNPGIMTLARRYRLHGLGAGLVLLVGLFVWRGATSLVPRAGEAAMDDGEIVTGKDSAAGFVNLLRRAVLPADLIPLCFAEWKKTVPRDRPDLTRKAAAMQDIVNLESAKLIKEQRPVDTYRELSRILSER